MGSAVTWGHGCSRGASWCTTSPAPPRRGSVSSLEVGGARTTSSTLRQRPASPCWPATPTRCAARTSPRCWACSTSVARTWSPSALARSTSSMPCCATWCPVGPAPTSPRPRRPRCSPGCARQARSRPPARRWPGTWSPRCVISTPGSRRSPPRCRRCSPSTAPGSPMLDGVGPVVAARLLGHTGHAGRFASSSAFANYAGVAPVEVASAHKARHRLPRGGDRQLNLALHVIALTQVRMRASAGRAYYDRKIDEGKTHNEAMRCLKRRLADRVWRTMIADERRARGGPGRTLGGGSVVQRGWLNPEHQLFGQVTSRTRRHRAYDLRSSRLTDTEEPRRVRRPRGAPGWTESGGWKLQATTAAGEARAGAGHGVPHGDRVRLPASQR